MAEKETSKKMATLAAKVLQSAKASKTTKKLAGSVLSQREKSKKNK